MNILIDIAHPAQVHLFKNLAWILKGKGHKILFTARNKEHCIYLLKRYGFDYISLGEVHSGFLMKTIFLLASIPKISKISKKFEPDMFLSDGSISFAFVSKIIHKPHVAMEDTGNLEQVLFYKPFTEVILSPQCLRLSLGGKQVKYAGYHELAYLHPKYFNPDKAIFNILGVGEEEKFVIMRFSAHAATHDFGYDGMPLKYKIKCVEEFSKYAKIFISSEMRIEKCLEKFKINIPPEKMHDVFYYASLVYSEGAKSASEASVLGTPAIYLDFKGRDYLRDQEKRYGTIFNYGISRVEIEKSIQKGIEILNKAEVKQEWNEKRKKIINENIDLTAFLIWFIERYPESFKILKNKPDFNLNLIKKQI